MNYNEHQLQQWLSELGTEMGSRFSLDSEGLCILQTDNEHSLALFAHGDNAGFSINAHLTEMSENNRELILSKALSLNLHQIRMKGSSIAWDEKIDQLFLCFTASFAKTDYQDFKNLLDNMVEMVDQLRLELSSKNLIETDEEPAAYNHSPDMVRV